MTEPSEPRSRDGAPPAEPTLFADLPPAAPARDPESDPEADRAAEQAAALSEAARGAVRQPADPRIDAHLAHLGLTDAPATPRAARTPAPPAESQPPAPDLTPEIERLETLIRALASAHDATTARVRTLGWAVLAVGIVAVVAFVLALVVR